MEVQAGIGWALWKSGNCKDTEGPLRNAIKLDPNYADSHDILGRFCAIEGHPWSLMVNERFLRWWAGNGTLSDGVSSGDYFTLGVIPAISTPTRKIVLLDMM